MEWKVDIYAALKVFKQKVELAHDYDKQWLVAQAIGAAAKQVKKAACIGWLNDVIENEKTKGSAIDMTGPLAIKIVKAAGGRLSYIDAVELYATTGRETGDRSADNERIELLANRYGDDLVKRLEWAQSEMKRVRDEVKTLMSAGKEKSKISETKKKSDKDGLDG